jgi:hypothetical protein
MEGGIIVQIYESGWSYFVFRSDWIAPAAAGAGFQTLDEALDMGMAAARLGAIEEGR